MGKYKELHSDRLLIKESFTSVSCHELVEGSGRGSSFTTPQIVHLRAREVTGHLESIELQLQLARMAS